MFEVEFVGGNLIGLNEYFNATGNTPMQMSLTISYAAIKYRGIVYLQKWEKVNPFLIGAAPTVINQEEPEVIDCYYTDLEGNENIELEIGKEVYLVLETENMIGETRDIDLSNNKKDFEYNGKRLENDMLTNFTITSDLQKIKLKVIAPQEEPITSQK